MEWRPSVWVEPLRCSTYLPIGEQTMIVRISMLAERAHRRVITLVGIL